jgi:superfamily I DNA and/or RNA helicase
MVSMPQLRAVLIQGMEKAVIILSTTVTRTGAFASDARRLNVALSRAKQHLFIVGKQQHMEL